MSVQFEITNSDISKSFSKIKTNVDSIKDQSKIRTKYGIASNEVILAYIKSSVPFIGLTMDGAILTNRAYYIHPCHKERFATCKVIYSDLCQYIISMQGEKGAVQLIGADITNTLVGDSLFGANIIGAEVLQLLTNLQQKMLASYDWAVAQQSELIEWALQRGYLELDTGVLGENTKMLLGVFLSNTKYQEQIALLLAESVYCTGDMNGYYDFLLKLERECSYNIKIIVENRTEKLSKQLLGKLSSITHKFTHEHLLLLYKNLTTSAPSEHRIAILYIKIRLREVVDYSNVCSVDREKLQIFQLQYMQLQMKDIYEALQEGKEISASDLACYDNFGLTPLHYALILNHSQWVEQLLCDKKWYDKSPKNMPSFAVPLISYSALALFLNAPNIEHVIMQTNTEIKDSLREYQLTERSIDAEERKLSMLNKKQELLRLRMSKARSTRNYQLEDECRSEFNEAESEISDIKYEICSLKNEMYSRRTEIEFGVREIQSDTELILEKIRASNHPLTEYILRLYQNPEFLYHTLGHCYDSYRIYTHEGFFFITPVDVNLSFSYKEYHADNSSNSTHEEASQEQESGSRDADGPNTRKTHAQSNEPVRKQYGNSWFSPSAHKDASILKKEYRALAHEHHPDVSTQENSQELFQEIISEYDSITALLK